MKSECIGCREIKEVNNNNLCSKCVTWEIKHHIDLEKEMDEEFKKETRSCSQCGYIGTAIDKHHIHGRKNSNVVIDVCCNCHREIHAGTRELVL